jgi:hypothetical protein
VLDRFGLVPVAVLQDPFLSDGAIVTYAAIAVYADRERIARPGWAVLCELRRISRSSLANHVRELIDAGHLERLERGRYYLPRLWRTGPDIRTISYPQGPDPRTQRSRSADRTSIQEEQEGTKQKEERKVGKTTFLPGTGWVT